MSSPWQLHVNCGMVIIKARAHLSGVVVRLLASHLGERTGFDFRRGRSTTKHTVLGGNLSKFSAKKCLETANRLAIERNCCQKIGGDHREKPPTDGIVRHQIPTCESAVTRPGIEPGSPWWEASVLIAQPPPSFYIAGTLLPQRGGGSVPWEGPWPPRRLSRAICTKEGREEQLEEGVGVGLAAVGRGQGNSPSKRPRAVISEGNVSAVDLRRRDARCSAPTLRWCRGWARRVQKACTGRSCSPPFPSRVIDGKTARQFSALRVEAMRELMRMSRSPLALPRFYASDVRNSFNQEATLQIGIQSCKGFKRRDRAILVSYARHVDSPIASRIGIRFPTRSLLDFRTRESCRTMPLISRFPRPYIPTLLRTHLDHSLSSALKTSMLRAAQISTLQADRQCYYQGHTVNIQYLSSAAQIYYVLLLSWVCLKYLNNVGPRRSGFNPRPGNSGFSYVGIVPNDAVGRRVFSGISRLPRPFILALLHTLTYPRRLIRPMPWPIPSPIPPPCATCAVSNGLAVDETLSPITYLPTTVQSLALSGDGILDARGRVALRYAGDLRTSQRASSRETALKMNWEISLLRCAPSRCSILEEDNIPGRSGIRANCVGHTA
ncbi:hypothetical protein PR048_016865 [Dryococelus australis]|uniref:Uncharacterized protein n=1 Tax=Dryococelus australis TaxID=614101 RepID=A0ABQ9H7V4_9NEOP|nr:hypothetical protein PR048_016865 [Dryococelus australis]